MKPPEDLFPESEQHELERQLVQALRPVAPPEGFAERAFARAQAAAPRAQVVPMTPRLRLWAGGALAAAILLAALLAQQTHARHQRRQAELAQQQFDAAIRITDRTLEHVRRQLQQAGVSIGN